MSSNAPASFASRDDTLYLKTLSKREARVRVTAPKASENQCFSLRTEDIHGACPTKVYARTRLGDQDPYGIESANARARERKKALPHHEDWMLKTSDIEGASCKFKSAKSQRCTNPLVPEYRLATAPPMLEYRDPAWDKPARDTIGCADVDGASPKPMKYSRAWNKPVPAVEVRDARVASKPRNLQLDVSDIAYDGDYTKTKPRGTNPLDPVYEIRYDKRHLPLTSAANINGAVDCQASECIVGPIPKSKPKSTMGSPPHKPLPMVSQERRRIASYASHDLYFNVKDIPGAQADTLQRGLKPPQRHVVNPLERNYPTLGEPTVKTCVLGNY